MHEHWRGQSAVGRRETWVARCRSEYLDVTHNLETAGSFCGWVTAAVVILQFGRVHVHVGPIFFPPGAILNTVVPTSTLPESLVTPGNTLI
jgi:hypothetical protein